MSEKYIIYTDGASRGNPGSAAIGVVISDSKGQFKKEYGERIGEATNNDAEYAAVLFALRKLKQLIGKEKASKAHIEVRMDSELVQRQLTHQYKITEPRLFAPFIGIWNSMMNYDSVSFLHIPREKNHDADRLANEALNRPEQPKLV